MDSFLARERLCRRNLWRRRISAFAGTFNAWMKSESSCCKLDLREVLPMTRKFAHVFCGMCRCR